MTLDEAGSILKLVEAAYPHRDLPDETKKLYLMYLRPFPVKLARERVQMLVLRSKWPPTVAELTEALGVIDDDTRRSLMRAVTEGGELVRDVRQTTGWALSLPGDEAPRPALPSGNGVTQGSVRQRLRSGEIESSRHLRDVLPSVAPPNDVEQEQPA